MFSYREGRVSGTVPRRVTITPFAIRAGERDASHHELALALAAELRPVRPQALDAELDRLSGEFWDLDADEQLAAAVTLAREFAAGRARTDVEELCIDAVVARRRGHPAVVATAIAEAARRGGSALGIVSNGLDFHLAHPDSSLGVLVDVVAGQLRVADPAETRRLHWRCGHQVAFALLRELVETATRCGDLSTAILAGELRLSLPLDAELSERMTIERDALRARLN